MASIRAYMNLQQKYNREPNNNNNKWKNLTSANTPKIKCFEH